MSHYLKLINIRMILLAVVAITVFMVLASTISAAGNVIADRNNHSVVLMTNDQLMILEHEMYLNDNRADVDDGMDAIQYEHSQKAKEAAYANAKLAEMNAYAKGGAK